MRDLAIATAVCVSAIGGLAACASSSPDDELSDDVEGGGKSDASAEVSTFYSIREGASPLGLVSAFVASRLNSVTTQCPGIAEPQGTCDVVGLDLSRARGLTLGDLQFPSLLNPLAPGHYLVRADLIQGVTGTMLDITEVWRPLTQAETSGVFVRLRQTPMVCPELPCESIRERKLNSALASRIAEIDYERSGATDDVKAVANDGLMSEDGLIIAGDRYTVDTPVQTVRARTATNAYLRILPSQ